MLERKLKMYNDATEPRFSAVNLKTGIRLTYAEQGEEGRPILILLHGITDSWFSFSTVLSSLAESFHTFALDQRGHGESDKPASGYAVKDFAADVVAFMDELGIGSATIAGHSMGSMVAQQVALIAPERVDRLVLIGSTTTVSNQVVLELRQAVESLVDPVPAEFAREFQESTIYQPLAEDFMRRVVYESLKLPARVWRDALGGLLDAGCLLSDSQIKAPTLILWGDKDSVFPLAEQELLAAKIPGSVLKVYAETGHALHWERPERFIEDLKDFIPQAQGAVHLTEAARPCLT